MSPEPSESPLLRRESTILVTGAAGMVGRALVARLRGDGYQKVLTPNRIEVDLRDADAVSDYFQKWRPEFVFILAARVGGIAANMANPVAFLADNARIVLNVFDACHTHHVAKGLYLGSSCVYPREAPQPMREESLMTGRLEPTNEGYALAKILGLTLARSYFDEFGFRTVCLMPCNIYGTGDHFDLNRAHVISSLVRRFVEAQAASASSVTVWGTGSARREFIHVDDVVDAMLHLWDRLETPDICNVGTGRDVSIKELAELIAEESGFTGSIRWDSSRPDGMPRKCLDVTRQTALGFMPRVPLREGIRRTIDEYRALRMSTL